MSNLTCPGCGSVYPLSAVQKFDAFKCAVCHETVVVPIAGPAPSRAAAAEPVRPAMPPAPIRHARPVRERTEAPPDEPARPPVNWGLVVAVAAVVAAAVVGAILLHDDRAPPPRAAKPADAPKTDAAPTPPAASPPSSPAPDPATDPAAWKALPAADRADRTVKYLTALDRRKASALTDAYAFFKARGETDAVRKVADLELSMDPSSEWAHSARGDVDVADRIDRCLAECVKAETADTPAVRKISKIRKERQPQAGVWWADAALAAEIDAALAQVRAEDAALRDPCEWAVAKWRAYRRAADATKDCFAVDGMSGPYLIFVEVRAPAGAAAADVPAAEMARAKRVLESEKTLFAAFYGGFTESFGKELGIAKLDRTGVDVDTVLKADVLSDAAAWERYAKRAGVASSSRADYQDEEPRFVVGFEPGADGPSPETDLALCRAATRQLLHFATWDAARKAGGGPLGWSDCRTRPPWLDDGFAAFFAPHARENGKFVWMRPDEGAMEEIWATAPALQKKRWATWSLDEMLAVKDAEQIDEQAARRVMSKPTRQPTAQQAADMKLAAQTMRPLFDCKSWSLVRFLWDQADASGKPLWRDAFVRLLAGSLRAVRAAADGPGAKTRMLGAGDFRKAMGLESEDRYRAFEKSWLAWETALLAAAQRPEWTAARDKAMEALGVK